jgi:hypothetical protein
MSVPIRREHGIDDPLPYAPHWARRSADPSTVTDAPPTMAGMTSTSGVRSRPPMARGKTDASKGEPRIDAPEVASRENESDTDLPLPSSNFAGDVAIKELRSRLSLYPDVVPQPPNRIGRRPFVARNGALSSLFVLAAIVALGAALMLFPDAARKNAGDIAGAVTPLLEVLLRTETSAHPARLLVESQKGFANEPLPLGVSLNGASGGEMVTLTGLAAGTNVSTGTPRGLTGWRVSALDLAQAIVYAPKDFVGVMGAVINLHSAHDRLVDRQHVRFEWIHKKEDRLTPRPDPSEPHQVMQSLDPEEITTLINRAEEVLKSGDIASTRLLLKRAAIAGDGRAALKLGMTFDPTFLAERGVLGFAPDVAQARAWYEKAIELGSIEASLRIERLASAVR